MKESIKQREERLRKAVLGWQNMYNRSPTEALDARLKQAVAEFEAAKAERKASKPAGSSMTSRSIPEKASITAAAGLTQREHKVVKAQDNLALRQAKANLARTKATQGQKSRLPSLDAVQPAPPTATEQAERLHEAVPVGNADDFDLGEGDEAEVSLDTVYPLGNQLIRIYTASRSF